MTAAIADAADIKRELAEIRRLLEELVRLNEQAPTRKAGSVKG